MDASGVVVPEETPNGIYGLFGKYRDLSNFSPHKVTVDGLTFHTSEAAYMAEKTNVPEEKLYLTHIVLGKDAKKYGQTVTLREDWDYNRGEVKVQAMLKVLRAKFSQHRDLAALLLSTGDKYLEETNWWGDKFWGKCGGEGRNMLGLILMAIRAELRTELYVASLLAP